jgi:predicted DNA-binding transcriptional regulator AlpA
MDKYITLLELCEVLAVSKSTLYKMLRDGLLPPPMRNPSNGRPVFSSEIVEVCRDVIKRRVGVNGQPFTRNRKPKTSNADSSPRDRHGSLILALSGLGLNVTAKQVDEVVKSLPNAGKTMEESHLVKQVFLRLRQNS